MFSYIPKTLLMSNSKQYLSKFVSNGCVLFPKFQRKYNLSDYQSTRHKKCRVIRWRRIEYESNRFNGNAYKLKWTAVKFKTYSISIQWFVDYIFIYIWDKVIFKLCLFLDYIIRRLISLNRPKESERNIWMSK